jgi:hypothetical protein
MHNKELSSTKFDNLSTIKLFSGETLARGSYL